MSSVFGSVMKSGGVGAAVTRSSILMVWGVGGSSMIVGWLSMAEMSKSMFSMVGLSACTRRSCPDGGFGRWWAERLLCPQDGNGPAWPLWDSHPHKGGAANRARHATSKPVRPPAPEPKNDSTNPSPSCNAWPLLATTFLLFLSPLPLARAPRGNQPIVSYIPAPAPVGLPCFTRNSQIVLISAPATTSGLHYLLISALWATPHMGTCVCIPKMDGRVPTDNPQ